MGNITKPLAFVPPDPSEAHDQMKLINAANVHLIRNSLGNRVALVWYNFNAEYTILYSHDRSDDLAGLEADFLLGLYLECNFCACDYSGYALSDGQFIEKGLCATFLVHSTQYLNPSL